MTASPVKCTGCGARGEGVYCQQCGTALSRPGGDRRVWVVASLLATAAAAAVFLGMFRRPRPLSAPTAAALAAASGIPGLVDLTGLSPREQFGRLFERMMRAGAEGDSVTVANLAPLATAAYARLDSVDTDTRFHAALIAIQTGNLEGAHALADTLEARDPGHLFGPVLLGALARLEHDSVAYRRALDAFRQRAGRELARADRPEYREHRDLLNSVQQAAEAK